jgi:hypothetical protein
MVETDIRLDLEPATGDPGTSSLAAGAIAGVKAHKESMARMSNFLDREEEILDRRAVSR